MSETDDPHHEAQARLTRDLDAFEASRAPAPSPVAGIGEASIGYRLLAGFLGGVFGGVGLGWTFDYFVHTSPLGLIAGLFLGLGVSMFAGVRMALAQSAKTQSAGPPPAALPDDDEDE
jgi:ATP synthase protein I